MWKVLIKYIALSVIIPLLDAITDILFAFDVTALKQSNNICYPGDTVGVGEGSPPSCQTSQSYDGMASIDSLLGWVWGSTAIGFLHALIHIIHMVYIMTKGPEDTVLKRLYALATRSTTQVFGWQHVARLFVACFEDIPQWLISLYVMDYTGQLVFTVLLSSFISIFNITRIITEFAMRGCCGIPSFTYFNPESTAEKMEAMKEINCGDDDEVEVKPKRLRCLGVKKCCAGTGGCFIFTFMMIFIFFSIGSAVNSSVFGLPDSPNGFQEGAYDMLWYSTVSVDMTPECSSGSPSSFSVTQSCHTYIEDYFGERVMPSITLGVMSGDRTWTRGIIKMKYNCSMNAGEVSIEHFHLWHSTDKNQNPIYAFALYGTTSNSGGLVKTMRVCDDSTVKNDCSSSLVVAASGMPGLKQVTIDVKTYAICSRKLGRVA